MTRELIPKAKAIIVLTLMLACLIPAPLQASGIGVSPPSMEIADALRGAEYERTIRLFNTDEQMGVFELGATGEISTWVTFHDPDDPDTPITSIAVPGRPSPDAAGTADVLVRFTTPEDAVNGTYSGVLYAETAPFAVDEGEDVQKVKLQVSVAVTISVTGAQILRGNVESITARNTEVGLPFVIKVAFANTGNVVAQPTIGVSISKEGETVAEFSHSDTVVKVGKKQIIDVNWDTTAMGTGNYTALVTVSLGGDILKTANLSFQILPRGSLVGEGRLIGLGYEQPPALNTVVKLQATFENTGLVEVRARLNAEVYRDGNLIDVVESQESLVPIGETAVLNAYFRPEQPGDYLIKGLVFYEGRSTEVKELSFTLDGANSNTDQAGQQTSLLGPTLGGVIGVLLIGGIFIALRRRGHRV
jgi:hypothetical protein